MTLLKKIFSKENTEKEDAKKLNKLRMLIKEDEEKTKKIEKKEEKKSFGDLLKNLFSGKKKEEKKVVVKPKTKVQKKKSVPTIGLRDMIKKKREEQKPKVEVNEPTSKQNVNTQKEIPEDIGEKINQLGKKWENEAQTETEITKPIISIEEKKEEEKKEPKTTICERCGRVLEIPQSDFTTRIRCVCGRRIKVGGVGEE